MAGPFLVIELRKLGKGKRVGLEEERGEKEKKNGTSKNFSDLRLPILLALVLIVRIKFF